MYNCKRENGDNTMSQNKIYVGNLSYNTTEQDLQTEFSQYGEIDDVNIIIDRETGRSKGFSFITYKTAESVEASLQKNGVEMDGRTLRVNKAEERKPRGDRNQSSWNSNRGDSGYGNRNC